MNLLRLAVLGSAALSLGASTTTSAALPITIDDFSGGPHLTSLTSFAPPEINLATFAAAGAVGGVRDVFVISETVGVFSAGVAFGAGGYASFSGSGQGGVVWDGVPGIVDSNGNSSIDLDELDYGLSLDLVGNCPDPAIHAKAFADLPGSHLHVLLASSATDWATYTLPLTAVGAFDDYFVSLFAPTVISGAFDPTDVRAIAMFHDGGDFPNLDIRVSVFEVICVPEPGTWLSMATLGGLAVLSWRRVRSARSV